MTVGSYIERFLRSHEKRAAVANSRGVFASRRQPEWYYGEQCRFQRELLVEYFSRIECKQRVQRELQFGQFESSEQQQSLQREIGPSRRGVSQHLP